MAAAAEPTAAPTTAAPAAPTTAATPGPGEGLERHQDGEVESDRHRDQTPHAVATTTQSSWPLETGAPQCWQTPRSLSVSGAEQFGQLYSMTPPPTLLVTPALRAKVHVSRKS